MKIAIVTNFLYPEGLGGTELYCYQLANSLIALGHEVYWFVPNFDQWDTIAAQRENGLGIVRFAAIKKGNRPDAQFVADSFIKELKKRDIGIAHFNEFGGYQGISSNLLKETKKANIRTVVTLHLVHYICQAGTVRYAGSVPCNGIMIPHRCASCNIFSKITSSDAVNLLLARFFTSAFQLVDKYNLHLFSKLKTGMNNFKEKESFINALREDADVVISLTEWFRDVLIINGIPSNKIIYLPQATPEDESLVQGNEPAKRNGYVFISRVNKEKGIDLLLHAAEHLKKKAPQIFIDLYGPIPANNEYAQFFLKKIKTVPNIRYKKVLDPSEVFETISRYKAFLLPSHVAEMAPLIIMEANKLHIPVIASDVPGSAELVKQYDCGSIFKYDDVNDFVEKILAIENNTRQFEFKQPVENNFSDLARKYLRIYQLHKSPLN